MKLVIDLLYLSVLCLIALPSFAYDKHGKKVVVLGDGVTGAWAAAKISETLNSDDELIIVSPPKQELVKKLGNNIFSHFVTSAFIPIGIQIEMGPLTLDPPTQQDVIKAQNPDSFSVNSKLYVSPDLDKNTKNKLAVYMNGHQDLENNKANLLRYHRDVCFKGWKEYIKAGNEGADFLGTVILSDQPEILQKVRKKIIKNRVASGYPSEAKSLQIIPYDSSVKLLPRYASVIKSKKLHALVGLTRDGRVRSAEVFKDLDQKIHSSKAKIKKIKAWVRHLAWHFDEAGNVVVTGVKLDNGKTIHADIVVSALGQGAEGVLKSAQIYLPILKKWGISYSLPQDRPKGSDDIPVIIMRGLGIVRDVPGTPVNFGLGEWILPQGTTPDPIHVLKFVKSSAAIWGEGSISKKWLKDHPISVQSRPMTLDGLPILDASTKGLIILNPSGSQGNTQAPGAAHFAASKVLEQLRRKVPDNLRLPSSVDWKQFVLYTRRFK